MNITNEALEILNSLLSDVSLDDVSSDSQGFTELQDGYYLTEVESAELTTSKSSGQPMVSFRLSIVEDGVSVGFENDDIVFNQIKKSKGRKVFKHFVLKDTGSIKRFASDMLKFVGDDGESLLPKEAFMTSETLVDALDILVGMRIYIQLDTTEKDDGTKSQWTNFISWKRVAELGLPQ